MDLIRSIMMEIEKNPDPMQCVDIEIPGRSELEISYHIMLLAEQGWVRAIDLSSFDGMTWKARSLTYEGHEFIDEIRSDTVWNQAKEKVISSTGTLSLEALKMVVPAVIRHLLTGQPI